MNQYELRAFIEGRNEGKGESIIVRLNEDNNVEKINYKNYMTYRIKKGEKYE